MTPIADMIEAMIEQGASLAAVLVAVRTIESSRDVTRDVTRHVMRDGSSRSKAALRAARYRENLKKIKAATKANDVAAATQKSVTVERDASRDGVTKRCDLSSLLSSTESPQETTEVRKKNTTSVVEGQGKKVCRGSQLLAGSPLSESDLEFALAAGMTREQAGHAWDEFVDYWSAVPGQRGRKLDWAATWRNRVRALTKGNFNGQRGPRPFQDDSRSLTKAADRLIEKAKRGEFTIGPRPGLSLEPSADDVRLLPKG